MTSKWFAGGVFLTMLLAATVGVVLESIGAPPTVITAPPDVKKTVQADVGYVVAQGLTWSYSTDGGKTFAAESPKVEPASTTEVVAKASFKTTVDKTWLSLNLATAINVDWRPEWSLNDKPIEKPLKDIRYRVLPAIPPTMLKDGENTLQAKFKVTNGGKQAVTVDLSGVQLLALGAADVQITDLVQGYANDKEWSFTVRTNVPVAVEAHSKNNLNSAWRKSPAGLFHRFTLDRYAEHQFVELKAVGEGVTATLQVPVPPLASGEKFTFAVVGDCRTGVKTWETIAAAVVKANPKFVVHTGDVVTQGINEWEWREQFTAPAKRMLASYPLYCVIGNHESNASMYDLTISSPNKVDKGRNWHQVVGPVLMIGIDGTNGWAAGGDSMKWLAGVLEANAPKAKYVFFFSHYPPWTSGGHGALNKEGKPSEGSVRNAQENIMPLLEKYKANAFIAGHDHFYERSEPAGGVSVIISGGGGAELRDKAKDSQKQNPHSKVFEKVNHYCLISVEGDKCTMRVIDINGKDIDTRTWTARQVEK